MTDKNETFDMDIELAHSLFEYRDGALYWKSDVARNVKAGDRVAKNSNAGHLRVCYDGKYHTLARIIFAMNHGYYPEVVDHINGDGRDNRLENLRAADMRTNAQNRKRNTLNLSGTKNVGFKTAKNRWRVTLRKNDGTRMDKLFKHFDIACTIAELARFKYHGEFARA
jgi:hypothetical protein